MVELLVAVDTEMSMVQRLKSTEVHKSPQTPPKRLIWIGTDTQINLGSVPLVRAMILQQRVTFVCLNNRPSHHPGHKPPSQYPVKLLLLGSHLDLNTGSQYRN